MDNLNRKTFIKMSSLTLFATLLPNCNLNAFDSLNDSSNIKTNEDFKKAQELAKEAKLFFYKKEYKQAETLYAECIRLAPRSIRFYDCLSNVYGAKSDFLSSVLLFKKGLEVNPSIIAFYDRLAHSLKRLELGNLKIATIYKQKVGTSSLLNDADLLLDKALTLNSSKQYLSLSKTNIKNRKDIEQNENKIAVKNITKINKKINKESYNKNNNLKTSTEITAKIDEVLTRKRQLLFNFKDIEHQKKQVIKQKNKYLRLLMNKLPSEDIKREQICEQIFNNNPGDAVALTALKKIYYKKNQYSEFIKIRERFSNKKQTVFSKLGLMDAIQVAFEKKQATNIDLEKAYEIGNSLLYDRSLIENIRVDVTIKTVKIGLLLNKIDDCKILAKQVLDSCASNETATINKAIYIYAKVLHTEQKLEQAKTVLLIGCNEVSSELKNTEYYNLTKLAKNKNNNSFKDNLILYYLLFDVYNKLNDIYALEELKNRIIQNDSNDNFIKTKK